MTGIHALPCKTGEHDDWFLEKDGKQYPDDPDFATSEAKREALSRRRRAKQACHNDCPLRLQCLDVAMAQRPTHGIWGGYFPEELRVVFKAQDARRVRRTAGVD